VTALFSLENVTLRRSGRVVLDGIDAELPRGATCIWGRSGAGKSNLLRLLNRLAEPTEGRLLLHEADLRSLDPLALRRRVAFVSQLPSLVGRTVAENVAYGPRLVGQDVPVDVPSLLARVDLDPELEAHDAARLSVGQQQRLMLARALALEPEVLLLDEPTSALDAEARAAVEETLWRLRSDNDLSIVLVTHDHAQATRLADWLVELDRGRLVRCAPVAEALVG
jgi:putative ABC transport system ATP-binding protein